MCATSIKCTATSSALLTGTAETQTSAQELIVKKTAATATREITSEAKVCGRHSTPCANDRYMHTRTSSKLRKHKDTNTRTHTHACRLTEAKEHTNKHSWTHVHTQSQAYRHAQTRTHTSTRTNSRAIAHIQPATKRKKQA